MLNLLKYVFLFSFCVAILMAIAAEVGSWTKYPEETREMIDKVIRYNKDRDERKVRIRVREQHKDLYRQEPNDWKIGSDWGWKGLPDDDWTKDFYDRRCEFWEKRAEALKKYGEELADDATTDGLRRIIDDLNEARRWRISEQQDPHKLDTIHTTHAKNDHLRTVYNEAAYEEVARRQGCIARLKEMRPWTLWLVKPTQKAEDNYGD